jgi:hypothetical protein
VASPSSDLRIRLRGNAESDPLSFVPEKEGRNTLSAATDSREILQAFVCRLLTRHHRG